MNESIDDDGIRNFDTMHEVTREEMEYYDEAADSEEGDEDIEETQAKKKQLKTKDKSICLGGVVE